MSAPIKVFIASCSLHAMASPFQIVDERRTSHCRVPHRQVMNNCLLRLIAVSQLPSAVALYIYQIESAPVLASAAPCVMLCAVMIDSCMFRTQMIPERPMYVPWLQLT